MNKRKALFLYGFITITVLSLNLFLTMFGILPDWWYVGLLSLETAKTVTMITAAAFLIIVISLIIWARKEL